MGTTMEEMETALNLVLDNARELQRIILRYQREEITRLQFVAGVDELSTKIRQVAVSALVEDISPEDIPY